LPLDAAAPLGGQLRRATCRSKAAEPRGSTPGTRRRWACSS